jgi:hypothetical protein
MCPVLNRYWCVRSREGKGVLYKGSDQDDGYEPDFNELVDDSSNELEIDMSEEESSQERGKEGRRRRGPEKAAPSAFRPVQESKENKEGTGGGVLGPYPAGATFVGYPPAPRRVSPQPVKPIKQEPHEPPKLDEKQYTILQPAGPTSRAALQELVRETAPVSALSPQKETLSPNPQSKGKHCLV